MKKLWNKIFSKEEIDTQNVESEVQINVEEEVKKLHTSALNDFKLGNKEIAVQQLEKALLLKPDFADAARDLSKIFFLSGQKDKSFAVLQKILPLVNDNPELYYYLGCIQQENNDLINALNSYKKALEFKPESVVINNNVGNIFLSLGNAEEAIKYFKIAGQDEQNPLANFSRSTLAFSLFYNPQFSYPEYFQNIQRYGQLMSRGITPYSSWNTAQRNPGDKIKIGFVSGDLRDHPVSIFLESLLSEIDRGYYELYAYSTTNTEDLTTQRLKPYFAKWTKISSLSDQQAAEKIYEDGLNVLIDLAGHTAQIHLGIFAYKPSPIQMTWLGYFGSTGIPGMDYIIADNNCLPEEYFPYFTEKPLILPNTRLCFTPPQVGGNNYPTVSPVEKNGYVTFGCYQNMSKINDNVIQTWVKILNSVPNSRLRIQSKQMDLSVAKETLVNKFEQQGISKERLILVGMMPKEQYLDSYAEVDILLDTFPYTGGTTTCEALWMGVPNVTINGDNMIARQGATFLSLVGLNDWIATNEDEYIRVAVEKSANISELNQLRASLREKMKNSPLMDAHAFACHFEDLIDSVVDQ